VDPITLALAKKYTEALILQAIENRQLIHNLDTGKEYTAVLELSSGQPRLKIEEVVV